MTIKLAKPKPQAKRIKERYSAMVSHIEVKGRTVQVVRK